VLRSIVDQARQGDEEAFGALVREVDEEVFGALVREVGDRCIFVAHRILRDANLAEDAVQMALVQVWRELPALRDLDRFEAWLHRILVNACYAEARRRRHFAAMSSCSRRTHRPRQTSSCPSTTATSLTAASGDFRRSSGRSWSSGTASG